MLLRAFGNLSSGIRRGEMFLASRLNPSALKILLERGVIGPIAAPPIDVIDALVGVADVLGSAGVATLEDLIEAKAVAGMTAAELKGWKSVAVDAMTVEKPCNCRRK